LIRPISNWIDGGNWSSESAEVHGISFEMLLQGGKRVDELCSWLNAALANTVVVTDAPDHVQSWLATLFRAADQVQVFSLHDYDALAGTLTSEQLRRHTRILDRDRASHRAGEDALRPASAFVEARTGARSSAVPWT
jgi:hypothetical protein